MTDLILIDEFDDQIETRSIQGGELLSEALMGTWPDGFGGMTIFVMDADGELMDAESVCDTVAEDGDTFYVALRPQFEPVSITILGTALTVSVGTIISAISLLASFFMRPDIPEVGKQYQWDDSDSPQFLSGQSNQFRPGSRVPDLFGKMRVWPDLIVEPWTFYEGSSQILDEIYVVSNGHCTITDARIYDETTSDMSNTDVEVLQPGDLWPADFPIMRTNAFVGAVELPGPNESISTGNDINLRSDNTIFVDVDGYFEAMLARIGTFVSFDYGTIQDDYAGFPFYRIESISADGRTLTLHPTGSALDIVDRVVSDGSFVFKFVERAQEYNGEMLTPSHGGWFVIRYADFSEDIYVNTYWSQNSFSKDQYDRFSGNAVGTTAWKSSTLKMATDSNNKYRFEETGFSSSPSVASPFHYVRWSNEQFESDAPGTGFNSSVFKIPGTTSEFSFDIEFPSGLYQQAAGKGPRARIVQIAFYFRLVGEEDWKSMAFQFTDLTRVARRFTIQMPWGDIAAQYTDVTEAGEFPNPGDQPNGEYECYFSRLTEWVADSESKVVMDACRIIGLRGRQDIAGSDLETDLLDCTLVRLKLSTQNLSQVTQRRSFNVFASRHLPRWYVNRPFELEETRRVRDAILYTLLGDGTAATAWTWDMVDVAALEAIQADLDAMGASAGQFNGIIDQTMTVEDQAMLMANNHRISIYRRAANIYFNRLKAGVIPRSLVNARNKVDVENKTLNFSLQNEPDAIIMRFADQAEEYKESSVQYPVDVLSTNPSEQTVIGITNEFEAQRLCQFLWDKRKYERDALDVQVSPEGAIWGPGDLIAVTDHLTSEKPIDGEIVAKAADVFTFDQTIPDGDYVGRLRDSFGDLYGDTTVVAVRGGEGRTRQLSVPDWTGVAIPMGEQDQVGLLYSLTPVTDADAELYQIVEVSPSKNGPVQISALRYDARTYQSDDDVNVTVARARKVRNNGNRT